jgi:predicted TIM-barrel fold metal-dependent hydrolase
MHCRIDRYPVADPFYSLVKVIKQAPDTRVVLVHGGDVEILKYAEIVRFNDNLLLDLSMTITKYQGSSLDSDIKFLFRNFDRRICIGTDHPEYSHKLLRERFEYFSEDVPVDKLENIAYRNLRKFLSIAQ